MFLWYQQLPGMSNQKRKHILPKNKKQNKLPGMIPTVKTNPLSINITHFIYGHPSVVQMKNIQDTAQILA